LVMSAQEVSSLWNQGTTKTYQIPIDHLDYKFIEKCTDVKHLEKILRILRSGEEGCYPDLTLFCEKCIERLAPESKALRKDKPAATASDFSAEEWEKINGEIKECSKVDEGYEENNSNATNGCFLGMTKKEKFFIANREKEKGNEAFVIGDYKEAVTYYIRSISAFPTVSAYNNKAQAEIKLQNWHNAFQDCKIVLEMEPDNVKALMRRATVHKHFQNYKEAIKDLTSTLHIEPDNEVAKVKSGVLVGGEIRSEKSEMGNAQKKFPSRADDYKSEDKETHKHRDYSDSGVKKETPEKRIPKRLPDHEGGANGYLSNGKTQGESNEVKSSGAVSSSDGKSISSSLPPTAAKLKSEGNDLFKNGQFGEAELKYSEAIENAINLGEQNPDDLSILYSNRAACYLKEGNCSDCIQDCSRALELHPFSLKPLLRRAMAYESMERYRQAYVDYKTVLQIDSGIQAANDSVNRITRTLIDQDGPNWREKLLPIPVVPVSAQQHRWDGGTSTSSETRQKRPSDEERFKNLKNEGNEFVKKGKFKEAVTQYSECMQFNSKDCTIYTNRALCYLKLFKYEEAKQDCDHVLQLEDSNIKAFYRRALAHKGLEVNNKTKMLIILKFSEITQLLNLKNVTESKRHRLCCLLVQVNESAEDERESSIPENAAGGSEHSATLKIPEKLLISKPSNAYEFGQIINAVNAKKDETACEELLTMIDPKDLPLLLSNKLEGASFLIIIQALRGHLLEDKPELVYQYLLNLSKAERFQLKPSLSMVLTLLAKNEKEQVQQLFDSLSQKQNHQFSLEDVANRYQL
uniref:Sperm associated antigen 1 n=1 Tax=Sphenodon punctatus TaxID=8508 RepID=A0A8D0LBZ0_SPHPU